MTDEILFKRVALIGIGLIGSSLALAMRQRNIAHKIACADSNPQHIDKALELRLVDEAFSDNRQAVAGADLVILCTPVGVLGKIAAEIAPHLASGCIISDVGSIKQAAIDAVSPHLPSDVNYIPAHPIAGTENSGPTAGFAELFVGRWCLLTPLPNSNAAALHKLHQFWLRCGAMVEEMQPAHHDRVLAIISHLPHIVAYTTIGMAADMETEQETDVIRYAASSFRDFTRVAASDPIMWRDIFLNNREAVLEIIERFTKDLAKLQKTIQQSDGAALESFFTRTRIIRRGMNSDKQ